MSTYLEISEEVSNLARKRIRKITFSTCNTANPDCYNVADAFIKRMKVREVDGFDGGALFDYSDSTLKKGNGEQHTWNKYVEKELTFKAGFPSMYVYEPTRERMGLRKYRNGKWSSVTKLYPNSI